MSRVQVIRSLLSRFLFLIHGSISVYLVVEKKQNLTYWTLVIPLFILVIDALLPSSKSTMLNFKYFWISGFAYISTLTPAIWIIELDLLDERVKKQLTVNETNLFSSVQIAYSHEKNDIYYEALKLSQESFLKKFSEIGLIAGVVFGRWLMPRGQLSHDQLSSLLLGYVGGAADDLGLFSTFEQPNMIYQKSVVVAVLSVYTFSVLQFTLVTTAVEAEETTVEDGIELRKKKISIRQNKVVPLPNFSLRELTDDIKRDYVSTVKANKNIESIKSRGKGKTITQNNSKTSYVSKLRLFDKDARRRAIHSEVFQILVTLFMHDGPYLMLRLYLIAEFDIADEMNIFFTCKNAFMSILLVYRFCILTCRGEDESFDWFKEEAAVRLQNVQFAVAAGGIITKDVNKLRLKAFSDYSS